jgi:hypothetical protein
MISMEKQLSTSNLILLAAIFGWLFWMEYSHRIDLRAPEGVRPADLGAARPAGDSSPHSSHRPTFSTVGFMSGSHWQSGDGVAAYRSVP